MAAMKRRNRRWVIWVAACLGVIALPVMALFLYWYPWTRDYGEAEPLVPAVMTMARDMENFAESRGYPPGSFDDLGRYVSARDYAILQQYPHVFPRSGPNEFVVRINRRFGFLITREHGFGWIFPENVEVFEQAGLSDPAR